MQTILMAWLFACGDAPAPEADAAADVDAKPAAADPLREQAKTVLGSLPNRMEAEGRSLGDARVELGKALYFDTRLSISGEMSCNSCHNLATYGVDNEPTSPGHDGTRGERNSPTVYNAALHVAQFWDGRAADVEEQATGPILNPIEMGMPDPETVLAKLREIEGYDAMFAAAFPDAEDAMTVENIGVAIGAYERLLVTPAPFDRWLAGDDTAMTDAQKQGYETFVATGCTTCHAGPAVGGQMYQKLGLVEPWPTEDVGRFAVTKNEADKHVFKVPSLRNVAKTGPWLHDGSVTELDEMIRKMAQHQLGKELSDEEVASIHSFLDALTGQAPADLVAPPKLPGQG